MTPDQLIEIQKERETFKEKALKAYSYGSDKANKNLIASSPLRLGLALNFAVFTYEILNDKPGAVEMAQKAIEVAMKKIENLEDEDERQDADTIIDMLHDNLKNWEVEEEEPELDQGE